MVAVVGRRSLVHHSAGLVRFQLNGGGLEDEEDDLWGNSRLVGFKRQRLGSYFGLGEGADYKDVLGKTGSATAKRAPKAGNGGDGSASSGQAGGGPVGSSRRGRSQDWLGEDVGNMNARDGSELW